MTLRVVRRKRVFRQLAEGEGGGSTRLFGLSAKHRNQQFNRYVLDVVDYRRGDEVLQVGELRFFTSFPKKVLSMLRNARRSVRPAI